jgi:hypothetical protein
MPIACLNWRAVLLQWVDHHHADGEGHIRLNGQRVGGCLHCKQALPSALEYAGDRTARVEYVDGGQRAKKRTGAARPGPSPRELIAGAARPYNARK